MTVLLKVLLHTLLLCGGLSASATAATAAPIRAESVTREVDYTLGSIAKQHVTVHVPPGFELDPASLPAPAQNEAIELREAHWTGEDVNGERVVRLDIDWQIFVAGDSVKIMPLKQLHLVFKHEQQQLTVDVPADKVIVSSLLPARIDEAHVQLYPDVPMPAWPLAPQLWSLSGWGSLLLLALVYLAWLAGWIQLPQEKRMPFRLAWRAMRSLDAAQPAASLQAMRLIVHAMDQFAGHAVTAENLPRLLFATQALWPYQPALESFYGEVQQVFFAGQPATLSLASLRRLAKQLSQLELA